jgi:hypothetical protein
MLRAPREIEDDPRVVRPRPQPNGMHVHAVTGGSPAQAGMTLGRMAVSGIDGRGEYADADYQRTDEPYAD